MFSSSTLFKYSIVYVFELNSISISLVISVLGYLIVKLVYAFSKSELLAISVKPFVVLTLAQVVRRRVLVGVLNPLSSSPGATWYIDI